MSIETQLVDNPYGFATGQRKTEATVNTTTTMGGFAKFRGNASQNEAARRFKSYYDQSQIGGAKAMDPAKEQVDGGGCGPDMVSAHGIDARARLRQIRAVLGDKDFSRFSKVVIEDTWPKAYARFRTGKENPNGRDVKAYKNEIFSIANLLCVHLLLST